MKPTGKNLNAHISKQVGHHWHSFQRTDATPWNPIVDDEKPSKLRIVAEVLVVIAVVIILIGVRL